MNKISIIIPAYNEEKRIGKTIGCYLDYFKSLKKKKELDFEIIVVLNACKDNTLKVVKKYKCKELRILNFEQGGKGFAIIEGFKDALERKNDLMGFVDADMATAPEAFYELIKNIKDYDGIIASRYIKGSKKENSIIRTIVSRIFNLIVRGIFLMNYRDTQCGAKLFKKVSVQKILPVLGETEWAFDVDLLYIAKKKGVKIKEFPTVWQEKGVSKLKVIKSSMQMFLAIVKLRIINSPFKRITKIHLVRAIFYLAKSL